jgi:hypothetical protein
MNISEIYRSLRGSIQGPRPHKVEGRSDNQRRARVMGFHSFRHVLYKLVGIFVFKRKRVFSPEWSAIQVQDSLFGSQTSFVRPAHLMSDAAHYLKKTRNLVC